MKCLLGFFFLATLPLHAANFLPLDALDFKALLPAPPAPDSPATRAEITEVLRLQATSTPAQAARCRQIEGEDIFLFGSEVLGVWFNAANLPQTAKFFTMVREDFGPINQPSRSKLRGIGPQGNELRTEAAPHRQKKTGGGDSR